LGWILDLNAAAVGADQNSDFTSNGSQFTVGSGSITYSDGAFDFGNVWVQGPTLTASQYAAFSLAVVYTYQEIGNDAAYLFSTNEIDVYWVLETGTASDVLNVTIGTQ